MIEEKHQGFSLEKILSDTTVGIATNAYAKVAKELGVDEQTIYYSRRCAQVSEAVYRELYGLYGENVSLMQYEFPSRAPHQFIELTMGRDRWIVDPTWQQFLPKPDPSKPRVLCVSAREVRNRLLHYGIPEALLHMWEKTRRVELD